jgi:hypothetical protein
MAMNTFEATIKLGSSGLQKVTVQADNWNHAKLLLERQYGRENVINVHQVQSG